MKPQKLTLQCDQGHYYNSSYKMFQQGSRCPTCQRKIPIDVIKKEVEKIGYKCLNCE